MFFNDQIWLCYVLLFLNSDIFCDKIYRRKFPCQINSREPCDHPRPFSFIWEIKRHSLSPPAYLFGTIHVPYTKVWDSIPQIAKDAFTKSDRIVFELDLLNGSTAADLSNCQILKNGTKLGDIIPRKLYLRLKRHLKYVKNKIPIWMAKHHKYSRQLNIHLSEQLFRAKTDKWERKGPIWVMMMLNSLTENDIKSQGIQVLDLFLADEARKRNKEIDSVENVNDQCEPLNSLNPADALFALNQTLSQHENIRDDPTNSETTTDELIHHYNCGNLNEIIFNQDTSQLPFLKNRSNQTTAEEFEISKQIDNYFRTHLIVNRNMRMKKQILELLSSNPNESLFFAFGAGHFIGKNSIIELLRKDGLQIVHINDRRSNMERCNPSYGHIRYPSPSRSGQNGANQRRTDSRAKGLSSRNPSITISPSNRNGLHEYSTNRQFIFYKPLVIKPIISNGPPVPFSLPSPPYGQNPWPSSLYTPRYLHLVSNSSSRYLSFNDLLVRAHFLNNNLPVTNRIVNEWPNLPAYHHEVHLSSSSRTRSNYPSWPHLTSANCCPTPSAVVLCLLYLQLMLINYLFNFNVTVL